MTGLRIIKSIDWDSQPLGKVCDSEIATRVGVGVWTVSAERKKRGIPVYRLTREINWDEQPFGKVSDAKIAERLGIYSTQVRKERIQRGIPPIKQKGWRSARGIDWDNQPLGKVSDTVLAKQLEVSRHSVYKQRRKRGIASAPREKGTRKRYPPRSIDWDNVPLGSRPDFIIARDLRIRRSVVREERRARGIEFSDEALEEIRQYQADAARRSWEESG